MDDKLRFLKRLEDGMMHKTQSVLARPARSWWDRCTVAVGATALFLVVFGPANGEQNALLGWVMAPFVFLIVWIASA